MQVPQLPQMQMAPPSARGGGFTQPQSQPQPCMQGPLGAPPAAQWGAQHPGGAASPAAPHGYWGGASPAPAPPHGLRCASPPPVLAFHGQNQGPRSPRAASPRPLQWNVRPTSPRGAPQFHPCSPVKSPVVPLRSTALNLSHIPVTAPMHEWAHPSSLRRQSTSPTPVVVPVSVSARVPRSRPAPVPGQPLQLDLLQKPLAELAANNSSEYSPRDSVWKRYFCGNDAPGTVSSGKRSFPSQGLGAYGSLGMSGTSSAPVLPGSRNGPTPSMTGGNSSGLASALPSARSTASEDLQARAPWPPAPVDVAPLQGWTPSSVRTPPAAGSGRGAYMASVAEDLPTQDEHELRTAQEDCGMMYAKTNVDFLDAMTGVGHSQSSSAWGGTLSTRADSVNIAAPSSQHSEGGSLNAAWPSNDTVSAVPLQGTVNSGSIDAMQPQMSEQVSASDAERSATRVASAHERGSRSRSTFDAHAAGLRAVASSGECITVEDLVEIASIARPHPAVREVVEMTLMLLGYRDATWSAARTLFERPESFIEKLLAFDASRSVSRQQFQKLCRTLGGSRDQKTAETQSPACGGIERWCHAVGEFLSYKYGDVGVPGMGQHAQASMNPASTEAEDVQCQNLDRGLPGSARAGGGGQVGGSRGSTASQPPAADRDSAPSLRVLGDLEVTPDIFVMSTAELQHVRDFTIRKPNVGEVTFQGEVDLSNEKRLLEDLPSLVKLELGEVVLYPDPATKPQEGEGLNRPATITLFQCMPPSNGALADGSSKQRYRDRIAQMTEAKGARFIDYDCDRGIWQFRVDHF